MASDGMSDEVMRRKLLHRETRMKKCAISIVELTSAISAGKNTVPVIYNSLIRELSLYQFQINKMMLSSETCLKEVEEYEDSYKSMEDAIAAAQKDIEALKGELSKEKVVRKNKEEYESLARVINRHPSRDQTEMEIENQKKEVQRLEEEISEYTGKIDFRARQFNLLLNSVYELQEAIKDEASLPGGVGTFADNEDMVDTDMGGRLSPSTRGREREKVEQPKETEDTEMTDAV